MTNIDRKIRAAILHLQLGGGGNATSKAIRAAGLIGEAKAMEVSYEKYSSLCIALDLLTELRNREAIRVLEGALKED